MGNTSSHLGWDHKLYNKIDSCDKEKKPAWSQLSKEEKDCLCTEQRCFECKDIGHESQNCPSCHHARAPTTSTGSVNIAKLEAKGNCAWEVDLTGGELRVGSACITDWIDNADDRRHAVPLIVCSIDEFAASEPDTPAEGASPDDSSADTAEVDKFSEEEERIRHMFCRHYGSDPDSDCFIVNLLESNGIFEIVDREDTTHVHWCMRYNMTRMSLVSSTS